MVLRVKIVVTVSNGVVATGATTVSCLVQVLTSEDVLHLTRCELLSEMDAFDCFHLFCYYL